PLGGLSSLILALTIVAAAWAMFKPNGRSLEGRAFVVDGDTIRIGDTRLRLKGIDAPEMGQTCRREARSYACGEAAREALIRLVGNRIVQCRASGRDRYQRVLAFCTVNGQDINARMVEEGWAVTYGREYEVEEARAQAAAIGLWAGEFERPQEWRRRSP